MFTLVAICSVAIFFPCNSNTAALRCVYGEQPVCGSDGFTYYNMCDLDIARSVRPNVSMKHVGRCGNNLVNAYSRSLDYDFDESLYPRIMNKRPRWRKLKKTILAHMINTQTNLEAFEFSHNNVNTQGTNNRFHIKAG